MLVSIGRSKTTSTLANVILKLRKSRTKALRNKTRMRRRMMRLEMEMPKTRMKMMTHLMMMTDSLITFPMPMMKRGKKKRDEETTKTIIKRSWVNFWSFWGSTTWPKICPKTLQKNLALIPLIIHLSW